MKRALLLIPVLAALGGCQTIELASGVINKINASINEAAVKLHDQCLLLQATAAIGVEVTSGKAAQAVQNANVVVGSYCSGSPPTDIPSALVAVSRAYKSVIDAKAAAAGTTTALAK